jgi:hypothetical protein
MDSELQEILNIAKSKGHTLPKEFRHFVLYPTDASPASFESFIVDMRIRPFLQLHILAQSKGKVLVGYRQVEWYELNDKEDADYKLVSTHKPILITQEFDTEQVFESLLASFGIMAIEASDCLDTDLPRQTSDGTFPRPEQGMHETVDSEVIILVDEDIILTSEGVYIDPQNKELEERIRSLLSYHHQEFQDILKRKEDTGIPHAFYIELLTKWFPGRVRTRRLPLNDS